MSRSIPLVDLAWQHRHVADEIREEWERLVSRTEFVLGGEVEAFETAFAAFSEVDHCVGVANGTDALELALRAVGIGQGDEVIVPANSFVASAVAVVRAGATPRFVDVDEATHLVSPASIEAALGPRTAAIMPVHLYGQMAPMRGIGDIAARAGVAVIEDAAQSQGARHHGRSSGSLGTAAGTSFYPGKNIGAYGDAGAVLTSDAHIADRLRRLRNYGGVAKYEHPEIGFNSRLDALQAVVLRAKLKSLAEWNELRRDAAGHYRDLLNGVEGVELPTCADGNEHVWHLYVVRVARRDDILADLQAQGVGAGIHYPTPLHRLPAFESLGNREGEFPVSERLAERILSLPIFPGITAADQEVVAERLRKAVR